MKISIITVAYNSADTIAETMDSVASQTYADLEHLVVDGASKDDTVKIAQAHSTPCTRITSEPDRGIYDAMNKGLTYAIGDIVCFLNADDAYADPEVLSRVAHEMQLHSLDALFGDVVFFKAGMPERNVRRYRSDRFCPDLLAYGWMPAHPALFMKRSIYQKLGGFRTQFRIAGDFDFVVRAFAKGQLRYRYLPLIMVRMQSGGVSNAGLRSKWLLNQEVLRSCRENGIRSNIFKILSKYPAKLMEVLRP
jgi:glycosyltransferase involved in cell wall biosynthesis